MKLKQLRLEKYQYFQNNIYTKTTSIRNSPIRNNPIRIEQIHFFSFILPNLDYS